jgi:hypothetical protein
MGLRSMLVWDAPLALGLRLVLVLGAPLALLV